VWHEKGKCRNGENCRFAHGMVELRERQAEVQSAHEAKEVKAGRQRGKSGSGDEQDLKPHEQEFESHQKLCQPGQHVRKGVMGGEQEFNQCEVWYEAMIAACCNDKQKLQVERTAVKHALDNFLEHAFAEVQSPEKLQAEHAVNIIALERVQAEHTAKLVRQVRADREARMGGQRWAQDKQPGEDEGDPTQPERRKQGAVKQPERQRDAGSHNELSNRTHNKIPRSLLGYEDPAPIVPHRTDNLQRRSPGQVFLDDGLSECQLETGACLDGHSQIVAQHCEVPGKSETQILEKFWFNQQFEPPAMPPQPRFNLPQQWQ